MIFPANKLRYEEAKVDKHFAGPRCGGLAKITAQKDNIPDLPPQFSRLCSAVLVR
jgi:hypothetical protein